MTDRRARAATALTLCAGSLGFVTGLILLAFSRNPALSHLGLILMVAGPVTAFWRLMKPRLAPHCPRPPEPGCPQ
jgi:predicted RND superfamily exporter protein